MASVHKRVRGGVISYRAVWRESGVGAKPRQRSAIFARAADAKAHAARMEQEVERRHVGDPERHTVEQFLARWLATLRDRDEHSPATLVDYEKSVAIAVRELGDISLSRLTAQHLDAGYARLRKRGGRVAGKPNATRPLKQSTLRFVHTVLHTAFEQARKWKLIPENPARNATPPAAARKSRVRAFSLDEANRLMEAASPQAETYTMIPHCLAAACDAPNCWVWLMTVSTRAPTRSPSGARSWRGASKNPSCATAPRPGPRCARSPFRRW